MICDAASMAVMIESMGSRSPRWMQLKREDFMALEQATRSPTKKMPRCIERQEPRLQHAISSLSSSSGSSNNEGCANAVQSNPNGTKMPNDIAAPLDTARPISTSATATAGEAAAAATAKVSSSSGGSESDQVQQSSGSNNNNGNLDASNEYHDYHAKPLPDPKLSYEQFNNRSNRSEESTAE